MMNVIDTAGLDSQLGVNNKFDRRKESIKRIREQLRNTSSTDEDWEDGLSALLELAQDKGD